jgi:hypothetical protein
MPSGSPKDEYLDASNNQRQFQSMRFAQLTVFLAIIGVILNLLFSGGEALTPIRTLLLKAAGLIMTLLFWVQQERTMLWWNHFVRRAAELEEELGFKQYSNRPPAGALSSFKAMRLFFIILTLFWIASMIWTF